MKKIFSVLAIALMSVCFVACGHKTETNTEDVVTVDTVVSVDTVVTADTVVAE